MRSVFFQIFASLITFLCACAMAVSARAEGELKSEPALTLQESQCRGNVSTSCEFILSYLYLAPGDPLNEGEIENAKLRLLSLLNFSSVEIHLEKGAERGQSIVVIDVVEASPITKEFLLGTSFARDSVSQRIAARVSHQNLFGTGKIIDFMFSSRLPISDVESQNISGRIQYVDPNLFGSKRYYLIAGGGYFRGRLNYSGGDSYESFEQSSIDLALGRRVGDFSYVTLRYQYRPESRTYYQDSTGPYTGFSTTNYHHNINISGGWNREDDSNFATHGDRAYFSFQESWNGQEGTSSPLIEAGASYRSTWQTASGSIWNYNLGSAPKNEFRPNLEENFLISFGWARNYGKSEFLGGIERSRFYVDAGSIDSGNAYLPAWFNLGAKAGFKFESETFGVVDVFLFATSAVGGRL